MMADDDGAAIDPRYDPAFQRGFSGQVQTGAHGQSTLRRTAAVNPAPARPAPQLIDASRFAPPTIAAAPPAETPALAPDAGPAPAAVAPVEPAAGPRELARNPFLLALAALALVLLLTGAIWAYQGFGNIVKNGGTRNEVEFWAAQTMSFGAPMAIIAGLAVVAVLLVIFGRSWQRSRH